MMLNPVGVVYVIHFFPQLIGGPPVNAHEAASDFKQIGGFVNS
jgi:hypothetical protein